jgi:hypothetical protein
MGPRALTTGLSARAARVALGALALCWLAAGHWNEQIDDVFITGSFARTWADTGALAWATGERVEGYSSFGWLALMRWLWLTHVDPGLAVQVVSLACGVTLVALVAMLAPAGAGGHLLTAAVAAWTPLAYWSAMGMETVAFALLCALALAGCLAGGRAYALGCALATAAALTRPEGHAWLLLCLATRLRSPRPGRLDLPLAVAAACVLALGAYHAARVEYFGELWPTSVRIKAQLGGRGPLQALGELSTAVAIAVATLACVEVRRRDRLWVLSPLALSLAVLLAVNGDWMGHGRLLLPGVVGSVVAALCLGTPRRARARSLALGAVAIATLGNLEPRFLEPPRFRVPVANPIAIYAASELETPLPEHVRWLVDHVPVGATVQAADVGMLSHIPGLSILDSRGLASRAFCDARGSGDFRALEARYDSRQRPRVVQVLRYLPPGATAASVAPGLDAWLSPLDAALARNYPHAETLVTRTHGWRGVTHFYRWDRARPSVVERRARWRALAARFPHQPLFRHELARLARR